MEENFWSPKDPEDIRDYWVNFVPLIGDETIVAATVVVPVQDPPDAPFDELVNLGDAIVGPKVVFRSSGGVTDMDYAIQYHVTDSSGQEFDLTKTLQVRERTA